MMNVIQYNVTRTPVNMEVSVCPWDTVSNVSVLLAFLEDGARSILMNVPRSHVIMGVLVLIYLKGIGVNALQDMQESIARKNVLIAGTIHVQHAPCAKTNPDITITPACAGQGTQELIAMSRYFISPELQFHF